MAKRVSIVDIARAAGVAPSTVSYVLNGKRPISSEIKALVLEQIEALGYRPNAVARSFSSMKTTTIGLYLKKELQQDDLFLLASICGINQVLDAYGYKLIMLNEMEAEMAQAFQIPVGRTFAIDGAIVSSTRTSSYYLDELSKTNTPFVLLGKPPEDKPVLYVDNNNSGSVGRLLHKFFEMGRQRVALLVSLAEGTTYYHDIVTGYREAYRAGPLPYDPELIVSVPPGREESAGELKRTLRGLGAQAVIVSDMGNTVMRQYFLAESSGAPQREPLLACISYDLYEALYKGLVTGPFYNIRSNAYELGRKSAQLLMDSLEGAELQTSCLIEQEIDRYD